MAGTGFLHQAFLYSSFFPSGHHVAEAGRAFGGLDVVLHPRQSLDLSSRGTTSSWSGGPLVMRTWCLAPVKALIFRLGAPRCRAFGGLDVVLHLRQSLDLSSRGTTSAAPAGHLAGRTWCFTPVKALIFRRGVPRRRARPGIRWAGRGASPPSKA